MKLRAYYLFSFVALIVLAAAYWPPYVNEEKEAILMQTILGGLNQLHYQPKEIDNQFSEKAFEAYLDRLDGMRRWLTQSDVEQLKQFRQSIDDQMDAGTYELFNLSIDLVDKGKVKSQTFYREILAQPFDLSLIHI